MFTLQVGAQFAANKMDYQNFKAKMPLWMIAFEHYYSCNSAFAHYYSCNNWGHNVQTPSIPRLAVGLGMGLHLMLTQQYYITTAVYIVSKHPIISATNLAQKWGHREVLLCARASTGVTCVALRAAVLPIAAANCIWQGTAAICTRG